MSEGRRDIVAYINFVVAFDSVSHRFLDHTLEKTKVIQKTHVMFRAIYKAAAVAARIRIRGADSMYTFSKSFNSVWGIQGRRY